MISLCGYSQVKRNFCMLPAFLAFSDELNRDSYDFGENLSIKISKENTEIHSKRNCWRNFNKFIWISQSFTYIFPRRKFSKLASNKEIKFGAHKKKQKRKITSKSRTVRDVDSVLYLLERESGRKVIPSAPRLLTSGEPRAGGLLRHRVASVATKKRKNKKNKNQKNTKGEGVNPRERRWRERRPIWRHERWIRTGQSSLLLASGGDYEGHAKGVRDPGLGLAGARGQFHSECGSDLISERALWPRCKTCALLRLNLQTLNNISSQAIKISKFFLFPIHHYLLTRNRNEHFCRGNLKRKNIYIYISHRTQVSYKTINIFIVLSAIV